MIKSSKAKIAAPKVSAIIVFVSTWDVSIKFYQMSAVDYAGVYAVRLPAASRM